MKLTFLELAEKILMKENKPLTASEIWDIAEEREYDKYLDSIGETPWNTLSATLHTNAYRCGIFVKSDSRPAKFSLRSWKKSKKDDKDYRYLSGMNALVADLDWSVSVNKKILYDCGLKCCDCKGIYALLRKPIHKPSYIGMSSCETRSRLRNHYYQKYTSMIKVAGVRIRNVNMTPKRLGIIEHALIYKMKPEMNKQKKDYPPDADIIIYNRCPESIFPKRIEITNGELIDC